MKTLLFIIMLLITATAVWFSLNDTNSMIVIEWLGYHVEMSSTLALVTVVLSFIVFYLLFRFLLLIKNIPRNLKEYYKEKREHEDLILMIDGFDALCRNDLNKAKKTLKYIINYKSHPQLQSVKTQVLLLITKCNELLYKSDITYEEDLDNSYQELLHDEQNTMIGLKGLIYLRLSKKRYHDALFYAEKAFAIHSKTDWLLNYLIEIYMELELYEKAERIIKKAADCKFITTEESSSLLIKCYIASANHFIGIGQVTNSIELLERTLKIDSACYDAVFTLARLYSKDNNKKLAHKIVEKAWKKNPTVEAAKFILNIYQEYQIPKKVKILEDLISSAPENEAGFLVLAELYVEEDMLPQARKIMDKLLSFHTPDYQISRLMALIETKSQNNHSVIANWLYKI